MAAFESSDTEKKQVRVWVDGCFDMVHFGHANAIRQAKGLGHYLLVGVHSDEDIEYHKGPPVFTSEERYKMVRAIKWVDEVVEAAPYITTVETLEAYNCDFCAHGDDITTSADGHDTYHLVKAAGKYKEFKRTEGVSTTDLVGRMLLATRSHHASTVTVGDLERASLDQMATPSSDEVARASTSRSPYTATCQFVPTTQRLLEFSSGRAPEPGEKIAYVCGAFDLFHVGHVDFLEKCYSMATYVIIGIHSDQTVNWYRGYNYPIMTMFERVLSVLACRYVSNVVIDAPYKINEQLLKHLKVDYVIHGVRTQAKPCPDGSDPYADAKRLGLYCELDSGNDMTAYSVIERIIRNRVKFEERNRSKEQKELGRLQAATSGSTN